MKIGVVSDTHGDLSAIKKVVAAVGKVDSWLHAGDYSQDGEYLKSITGCPVTAAKGNCDGQAMAKIDEFLEINGITIWLTHGHRYHVKQGLSELRYWAKQYNAAVVVYGHTHTPVMLEAENVVLFNPGSAAQPVDYHLPTCGIISIEGKSIEARHIEIITSN